jgi:hypothetical protein
MRTSSPTKAIISEDAHFPLVEVRFGDGHEDHDWAWLLRQFQQLFTRKQPYALLLDAGSLTRPPSAQARLSIADWQKAHEQETSRCCVGSSLYIASGLIRGAFTAMNWFAPQVVSMNYPSSLAEGLDWCVARLDAASIVVPSAIRQRQVAMLRDSPVAPRVTD